MGQRTIRVVVIRLHHRSGKPWALRWRQAGHVRQQTIGIDRRRAERARAQKEDELNGWACQQPRQSRSLDELVADYLASCRNRLAPRAVKEYALVCAHFLGWLRTTRVPAAVTPILAERYMNERLSQVRPATADKELRTLRRLWRWLVDHDEAPGNPWAKVTRPRITPLPHPVLNVAQCQALLRACQARGPTLAAAVAVALDVGLRIGELAALRPEDIDLAARRIRIQPRHDWTTKSNRPRDTVVLPGTAALLAPILNGQPYVLAGRNRSAWQRQFRRELKAACRAAGVPVLTPHDLRRTAATLWAECVPAHVLNSAFGWVSAQTAADYYIRLDRQSAADRAADARLRQFGDFLDLPLDSADGTA